MYDTQITIFRWGPINQQTFHWGAPSFFWLLWSKKCFFFGISLGSCRDMMWYKYSWIYIYILYKLMNLYISWITSQGDMSETWLGHWGLVDLKTTRHDSLPKLAITRRSPSSERERLMGIDCYYDGDILGWLTRWSQIVTSQLYPHLPNSTLILLYIMINPLVIKRGDGQFPFERFRLPGVFHLHEKRALSRMYIFFRYFLCFSPVFLAFFPARRVHIKLSRHIKPNHRISAE